MENRFEGSSSDGLHLSPEEIIRELKRIESEYDQLEREANLIFHEGYLHATSRFLYNYFLTRYKQVSMRYNQVRKAITRLYN